MFDKVFRPQTPLLSPARVGEAVGLALGTAIVLAGFTVGAAAQQAAPAAAAPAAAPVPQGPPPGYVYDPAGRRDPFTSLNRASADVRSNQRGRASGLAGLAINEATVKGVVKSQGRLVAMLQAPDNKTYIVKANDRLLDGAVRAVTPEAVVFVQNVNDPLKMVTQREIRKPLRIVEEAK